MPIIFILLAIFSVFLLLYPYPATVFLAACLSIITLNFFNKLRIRFSLFPSIAIFASIMILSILLPITLVVLMVTPQAINGMKLLQQWRNTGWAIPENIQVYIDTIENWIANIPEINHFFEELSTNFIEVLNSMVSYSLVGAAGFAGGVFNLLWHLFLFVILTILCLMYANEIKAIANKVFSFHKGMLDRFILTIRAALGSVVNGILLVALLQGIACTIGFTIFQVPEPLFWGLLACIVAPIPLIGTALVWVPLAFVLWFIVSPAMSLGLVAWCMLVVAGVDNFARPYFLSKGIKAPFFVLFLSILCGLAVFGSVGLIVGPVLLAFSLQCIAEAVSLFDLNIHTINHPSKATKTRKTNLLKLFRKNKSV